MLFGGGFGKLVGKAGLKACLLFGPSISTVGTNVRNMLITGQQVLGGSFRTLGVLSDRSPSREVDHVDGRTSAVGENWCLNSGVAVGVGLIGSCQLRHDGRFHRESLSRTPSIEMLWSEIQRERFLMDALDYVKDLVAFESTSVLSNVAVSDYAQDALRRLEFDTERLEYTDKNGVRKVNILGKKGSGRGGMAYFGHTDVVPADPWFSEEHGPFSPTVKDGRVYGRGCCDMKGSVSCMLAAASQFSPSELKQPVYITLTADEEIGFGGAKEVTERSELYAEMIAGESNGIIGEPTRLEVVYAHKGTYGFKAISRGKAAHSSTRSGLNANLAMIPFLAEMKRIHDETEADPHWQNDEFDPPTVTWNIGINDLTTAVNITPPQSICTVYFRPMPGQDSSQLMDRVRSAAEEHGLELEVGVAADAVYSDPKSAFVKDVLAIAGREKPFTVAYGTDGAMFTGMKKLVVIGPGDIAQAHTHDEWVALDQLQLGTDLYARMIREWCS